MPFQEVAFLEQTALLWAASGVDRYGQVTVLPPVEIPVRWLTKRREVLDAKGNTIALDAQAVVRQRIAVGSHLWLGNLVQWYGTGTGSSLADEELMEVKTYDETPDLKDRGVFRIVGLMRLHQAH
jgi:hypothetical protein